ncbi:hypothetical protein [Stutzerimonas nitrititolerans]
MRKNAFAGVSALALCLAGTQAFAQSATGPISNFGVIASHNQYKLTIADESDKERLNQGGLYYSFGNKLTGQEGFIYEIGIEGQYRDKDDVEFLSARADLDLGLRAALSTNNYVDLIVGGGYDWGRIEQNDVRVGLFEEDVELTTRSPFAKAGVGYNYLTPDYTLRLEVGARYSIEAESRLKVAGESDTVDLKDKANPYGELTVLWNKGINNIPVSTSLYYSQTRYELDSNSDFADNSKLKQEEVGLKVGLAF